jgi:hypothetical protein
MTRLSYQYVSSYAQKVSQTGIYSRTEMEAILSAKFLHRKDWLPDLVSEGLTALGSLQLPDQPDAEDTGLLAKTGSLICLGLSWLMGDTFGEPQEIISLVLDHLEETHAAETSSP